MFVSLSGCMGAESIQRFDRLHQHQRNIVPTVRLLVPSNGMDSYGRPPDEDHFWMADVEGLPNGEIGSILGLSVPAVKSRLHRARLLMRDELAPHFEEVA